MLNSALPRRAALESALDRLVREGHVARVEQGGRTEYRTDLCLIPFGTPSGWEAAVLAITLLGRLRAEAMKLREKITAYNADNAAPDGGSVRVLAYMGQTVLEDEQNEGERR